MNRSLGLLAVVTPIVLLTSIRSRSGDNAPNRDRVQSLAMVNGFKLSSIAASDPDASSATWAQQLASAFHEIDNSTGDEAFNVLMGSRTFDSQSAEYEIHWGDTPHNVVKVIAAERDPAASSSKPAVTVFFQGVFGEDGSLLRGEATAYTDAPDLTDAVESSGQSRTASPIK